MRQRVLAALDAQEVVELTRTLIRLNTINPPGKEAAAAETIRAFAQGVGLDARVIPISSERANVLVRLRGRNAQAPRLLYCGHLDTVPLGGTAWDVPPFGAEIVDGHLYGRGASDMKGGVAAAVAALASLSRAAVELPGDLLFLGLVGEEVDCTGARHFLRTGGMKGIGWLLIAEPTNLDLVVAHKGALRIEMIVRGRSSHASRPDLGVNAIVAASTLVGRMTADLLPAASHPWLTPATLSVDTIEGGSAINVVPDLCRAAIDIRTIPGQAHEEILERLQREGAKLQHEHRDLVVEFRVLNEYAPVETPADHQIVGAMQEASMARIGRPLTIRGVSFYSDASILQPPTGVPTIIFGPGDDALAHQRSESVAVEALSAASAQLALLPLTIW